jgi:DNA sulfur modification protein DndB
MMRGQIKKTEVSVSSKSITANLHPLLVEKSEKIAAYKKKRDAYLYESIHPADLEKYESDGWEIHRESKTRIRMKRLKGHAQFLEDQTWCLFYRMGYPEINGDQFKITYTRADGSIGKKQIDVFAKDSETVIIAECKSRESRGRRPLQKDLHETDSLQKAMAGAVREYYGSEFKPKIIWLYVTNNIIWSEPDIERAAASNIRIITENEMQYFDAFIKHMGPAGRYQFLAEFLEKQEIPNLSNIKVPAIRGKLGGRQFYSFVTTPRHLLKIAFVNHQALNHPDGRPAYQRMIAPSRIREIEGFIKRGGYFPTNILVNFTEKCRFDLLPNKENADPHIKFGTLYLPNKYKSAWIIDGQHRLYGYSHLDDDWLDQSLAVIAFEEMDTKDEAELFVTINQKQKSVQRSVIVTLQSDLKWGSTDPKERLTALASALVKSFNSDPTSPFFQRFSVQGVESKDNQSLTFPEFVNGLTRSTLIGRVIHKTHLAPGSLSAANDELTLARARRIINYYFTTIRDANPVRWEAGRDAYICTNPGIRAHLKLLSDILNYVVYKYGLDVQAADEATIIPHINKLSLPVVEYFRSASDIDINEKFSRRFGEGGVIEYFDYLCEIIQEKIPDFGASDFHERQAKRKDERVTQTHQDVIKLNQDIADYIIRTLKEHYGTDDDESGEKVWWEQGIESQKAKENAYKRYLEGLKENKDKKLPKEAYLDVLDYRDIVRQKNNWPLFEKVFNIPLPGEKGKTYYLDWMEKLNKIRRVPAHPSGTRGYDEDDYAFMKYIKQEFYSRLQAVTNESEGLMV